LRIFFDVDGVLIDGWHSRPERRKPWDKEIERDLGIDRAALQQALFGPGPDGGPSILDRCSLGESDLKQLLAGVLPRIGFHGPVERFLEYWFAKDSNVSEPVLSVVRILAARGDVALYIATNQERHRADWLWDRLGLRTRFLAMFTSAGLGRFKTDPAFFSAVDEELGPPAVPPLLIDDSAAVCSAALRAGWDACCFDTIGDLLGHPRIAPLLAGEAP
jgi:putative hydrolase of the HAD superfamily